ncbi:MAG: MauE/DoxX family redox-associated membrane protein, partial [Ferruginibacter sp.]
MQNTIDAAYIYDMKRISLIVMSVFYLGAGINHFWHTAFYEEIMPSWLPWHTTLVIISGVAEAVLGLLLLFTSTRRIAAWLIIVLLIAVFPANIQMMFNYARESNPKLWIAIVRLPIQILLIWWAYGFTKDGVLKTNNCNS